MESLPDDPFEVYSLADRHHMHKHFVEAVVNRRDWIPAAIQCERPGAEPSEDES